MYLSDHSAQDKPSTCTTKHLIDGHRWDCEDEVLAATAAPVPEIEVKEKQRLVVQTVW